MKIVVLMKVVPDTETRFEIREDGTDVVYDDRIQWIISPYDEYALEEAIQTKEKLGGTVTILTLGKGKEQQVIRKALAMGADDSVLINSADLMESDALGIARIFSKELEGTGADLIFAGKVATDSNDGYVGAAVAELMGIPVITEVSDMEVSESSVVVTREASGRKEKFEVTLPAIVTIDKGINEPRYPKLPQIMKAKRKPLDEKDGANYASVAGSGNSKVKQIEVKFPPKKSGGEIFEGDDAVDKLVDALMNKEKVVQ